MNMKDSNNVAFEALLRQAVIDNYFDEHKVNGDTVYVSTATDSDFNNILIGSIRSFTVSIEGNLLSDELIKIFKSIEIVEK